MEHKMVWVPLVKYLLKWRRGKLLMSAHVLFQNHIQLPPKKLPRLEAPGYYILVFNLMLEVHTDQCQFRMVVVQEVLLASTMGLGRMDLMLGGPGQFLL
jgi:hypothetical protein